MKIVKKILKISIIIIKPKKIFNKIKKIKSALQYTVTNKL